MKVIIKTLVLSMTLAFGGTDFTVLLSCDKLPEYTAICKDNATPSETVVEAPIYTITQSVKWGYGDNDGSDFVGDIEIRYLDESITVFNAVTASNGKFTANIVPNKEFYIHIYDTTAKKWSTHKTKFVLRISSSTGNLLWKRWKVETSRWIKLDLNENMPFTPNGRAK